MNDYAVSLIRTAVPAGVALLLAWLARRFGFVLDEQSSAEAMGAATALALVLYYAVVRALEQRWPWVGRLLGAAKKPAYGPPQVGQHRP